MSIKTKVTTIAPDELDYPRLMRTAKGIIVLFTDTKKGTVVNTTNIHPLGFTSVAWVTDDFTDFKGTLTLQNE